MNINKKEVGKRFRELRKQKKLTLVELQEKSGVSNSYLSQIENGQFIPSTKVLEKLALGLKVDYHYLMYLAGYIDRSTYENNMVDGELIVLDLSYLQGLHESIFYKDKMLTDDEIKQIQTFIDIFFSKYKDRVFTGDEIKKIEILIDTVLN